MIALLVCKSDILLMDVLFALHRHVLYNLSVLLSQFCSVIVLKLVKGYEIIESKAIMQ